MTHSIVVPSLGATGGEMKVSAWLTEPGGSVKAGSPLFVVETDKADMEVEAFRDGFLRAIVLPAGSPVGAGDLVGWLTDTLEEPVASPPGGEPRGCVEQQVAEVETATASRPASAPRALASPLARRMARELGLDLAGIQAAGESGRIHKADVLRADAQRAQASNGTPVGVRRTPVSSMRRGIARRTVQSKTEAPHFYVSVIIDVGAAREFLEQIVAWAKEKGLPRPSFTDLALCAAALALREVSELNASYQGDAIAHFDEINIGLVVAVRGGMMVPVVHRADRINLFALAAATRILRDKAAAGTLSASDLTGSTFSLSNLGMFGVDSFIAVINPPEAAILAIGAIRDQPAVWKGQIVARPQMTATLSADHRVVDGVVAAQFLGEFRKNLESPIRLLLAGQNQS